MARQRTGAAPVPQVEARWGRRLGVCGSVSAIICFSVVALTVLNQTVSAGQPSHARTNSVDMDGHDPPWVWAPWHPCAPRQPCRRVVQQQVQDGSFVVLILLFALVHSRIGKLKHSFSNGKGDIFLSLFGQSALTRQFSSCMFKAFLLSFHLSGHSITFESHSIFALSIALHISRVLVVEIS